MLVVTAWSQVDVASTYQLGPINVLSGSCSCHNKASGESHSTVSPLHPIAIYANVARNASRSIRLCHHLPPTSQLQSSFGPHAPLSSLSVRMQLRIEHLPPLLSYLV